jgi:hypothetical protein
MLTILIEHEGATFSVRSGRELLPEIQRAELAMVEEVLGEVRCPEHGEPSGFAHVTLTPLGVSVDEPCCSSVLGLTHVALGLAMPA